MGASAREIEQQIKETRERMDENLGTLENRAASGALRYAKIAAIVVGATVVAGAGFIIWRKTRRPTIKDRLDRLTPDGLRALADEVAARLQKPLPSVRVTVNGKSQEPGTLRIILRRVAPAIVGSASTALLERVARPQNERGRKTSARASSG